MLNSNLFVPTDVWPEVYIAYSDGTLSKIWYSEWLCYVVPVYANNGYRFTHLSVNNAVYICSLDSNKNIIQNTGLSQNNQNLAYTTHEMLTIFVYKSQEAIRFQECFIILNHLVKLSDYN